MSARARGRFVRLSGAIVAMLCIACSGSRKGGSEDAAVPVDTARRATTPDTPATPPYTTPASAPHIDAVVPESLSVQRNTMKELLIRGSGFAAGTPGRNTVMIGPIRLTQVPANAAGTEIRVVIPDRIVGQSEAPPRPVLPGTYPVTVETVAGTSNVVNVQVLP